jgi:hypothetical protein
MALPAHTMIEKSTDRKIARPLRVLVPLIQEDLKHGKEAAARAGLPHYRAAGEKLLEARPQHSTYDAFVSWTKRNFNIGKDTAAQYMKYAAASLANNSSALESTSLSEFIRKTSNPDYNRPSSWHEPVRQIVNRVDTETLNLKRDELERAEERAAQRKLALQLIDIGFKVLARKLHPDKGGSKIAMTRLNTVRDRLRQNA